MSIGPDQLRLNSDERANLVAYIDGELTDGEARALASKLTQSATARREVEMLRKTWELLGHLSLPSPTEQFSERTLTQVRALELHGDSWNASVQSSIRVGAKLAACALVAAGALGLGFVAMRWVWPDPTARMASDLSMAEHLDEYLEVGTFEFLTELVNSKEFGTPSP
jgi:anti-sigma factor RsiW